MLLRCLAVRIAVACALLRAARAWAAAPAEASTAPSPGSVPGPAPGPPPGPFNDDAVLPTVEVPVVEPRPPSRPPPSPPAAPTPNGTRDETGLTTRVDAAASPDRSAAELVAAGPGTAVHHLGDDGQYATATLRGSGSDQLLVLLDGLPLTSAAGATVDLSTIPAALIDHVDILRGDAAALYGAGALGGVLNVVTRRPAPGDVEAALGYGSWNTWTASAFAGGRHGTASGALGLSFFRSDGDFTYPHNPTPDLPVAPVERVRLNNQSLVLGGLATGTAKLGGGDGELIVEGAYVDRGLAGTEFDPTLHDHLTEARGVFGVSWKRPAALGPFELDVAGQGRADSLDVRLAAPGSADQLDLEAGATAALSGAVGIQRLTFSAGGGGEALLAGPEGSPGWGTAFAAAADRLGLLSDRLLIIPVARIEEVGPFAGASAKLGLSASPWRWLMLLANGGRGFRAPSFGELYVQQGVAQPNPALTPETNWSADAAVSVGGRRARLTVDGFVSRYDNLILYELYPPEAARPFNEGAAVVQGVEAELGAAPLPGLTVAASYTFLDTFNDDPLSPAYGRPEPDRPQHHGHAYAAFERGRLRAGASVDLESSQTLNHAGTLSIPGHAVLDAWVGLRLWNRPAVWLSLEGRNLTNSQAADTFGYPLPGTSLFASLRFTEAHTPQGNTP